MTIRTVGELRAALAGFPDYRALVVEVTVGGDLVTDVVDLERLSERIVSSGGDTAVVLHHAPDPYDVRALIDDGLRYREQLLGLLPNDDARTPGPRHADA